MIASFVIVAVVTAMLATLAQTQFVISGLKAVDADISLDDRLSMTLADLAGLAPLFGAFIALALAIAFGAAALTGRLLALPRALIFLTAGAAAIGVMLAAMEQVFFGVQVIAGARFAPGFITQLACGAFAGLLYAKLTAPPAAKAA